MGVTLPNPFAALRSGVKLTARDGSKWEFTPDIFERAIANHQKNDIPIPLTPGHDSRDALNTIPPDGLALQDGHLAIASLTTEPDKSLALLSKANQLGLSAGIWTPDHPENTTGDWLINHLAVLGGRNNAADPTLAPSFSRADLPLPTVQIDGTEYQAEFGDYSDRVVIQVFQAMREWLIETQSMEVADRLIPSYALDMLREDYAMDMAEDMAESQFSTPSPSPMTKTTTPETPDIAAIQAEFEAQKAKMQAEFEAEKAKLQAEKAEFERQQAEFARASKYTPIIEQLATDGKIHPSSKSPLVAAFTRLDLSTPIEFSTDDGTCSKPLTEILLEALGSSTRYDYTPLPRTPDPANAPAAEFSKGDVNAINAVARRVQELKFEAESKGLDFNWDLATAQAISEAK